MLLSDKKSLKVPGTWVVLAPEIHHMVMKAKAVFLFSFPFGFYSQPVLNTQLMNGSLMIKTTSWYPMDWPYGSEP